MNAVASRVVACAVSMPALVAVATVASAAGVLGGPQAAAIVGGVLLGFVLPGLALTALIVRHRTLSAVERTVLAPAFSLAVLVLAGLILQVAGLALDRTSWTLATGGVTLAVLGLRAVPRAVRSGEEDGEPGDARPLPGLFAARPPRQKVRAVQLVRQVSPLLLVLAILGGAGYLSFVGSQRSYEVTVTALSAAPPGDTDAAGARTVDLAASGLVPADGPYRMTVTDPTGAQVLEQAVPFDADGTWRVTLRLPSAQRLTVSLFRARDTAAYRTLSIAAVG